MRKIATLLLLYFVGTVLVFTFRPLGDNNALLEQGIYCFISLVAASSAFLALRVYGHGPRFRSLLCLALGLLSWFVADVSFIYQDFVLHNLPYPSIADYFYLLAYVLLFSGLMLEVFVSDVSWKKLNKIVYLGAGAFAVIMLSSFSYLTLFSSYSPEATLGENIVTIGYSLGDLLLVIAGFFILLVAWEYRGGKAAKVWMSLFLGFFATLIADLIYAAYTDEFEKHIGLIYSLSQYCYILGYLFITHAFLTLKTTLLSFQKRPHLKK